MSFSSCDETASLYGGGSGGVETSIKLWVVRLGAAAKLMIALLGCPAEPTGHFPER